MRVSIVIGWLCLALLLYPPLRTSAQVGQGEFGLYQNGIKVGEVYVPERAPGDDLYVEHWVLFPGYRSPDARSRTTVELRPVDGGYTNTAEFFQSVSSVAGARYVKVVAHESAALPCL